MKFPRRQSRQLPAPDLTSSADVAQGPTWEEGVFAGLLALTEHGDITWTIYPRLPGAMRTTYGGEDFWLWRERLLIDAETELRICSDEGRRLRAIVHAEHDRQIEEHKAQILLKAERRRQQIDTALNHVIEAAE